MPRAGFEPVTPATKRSQTYALERAATGIGVQKRHNLYKNSWLMPFKEIITIYIEYHMKAVGKKYRVSDW
jgi:hypothetical protein